MSAPSPRSSSTTSAATDSAATDSAATELRPVVFLEVATGTGELGVRDRDRELFGPIG